MHSPRLVHFLYTTSLFLLILLLGASIALSAVDVIIQARSLRTPVGDFDFRNLTVVAAGYFLLTLYRCLQKDFKCVEKIKRRAIPKPEDARHPGWAIPGNMSTFEGISFKRTIAQTPLFIGNMALNLPIGNIEKAAIRVNPGYARPPYITMRQYIDFLIQQGLVDAHLGQGYRMGYEQSRFRKKPISEERFLDIMKHLAAILRNMDYPLNSERLRNSRGSSPMQMDIRRQPPDDDDVTSLAHSVATWATQSTSLSRPAWISHQSTSRAEEFNADNRQTPHRLHARIVVDGIRSSF
ncbi:hypothetical protein BX666DRAFT_1860238 [Dichotomocladium elegans]|nr:hypothetical protein BX666DRAFT_1860238 [Dichotomocladium elegans]